MLSPGGARGVQKAELNGNVDSTTTEAPQGHMYYIGLDVHKKTISYCVKDASGQVHQEGKVGATRWELDDWMTTLPQPWTVAMEATIFTGWIYDHLLPHAPQVKVAHPLMLRAIAAAKKKNDRIDACKIADCLRCNFLPECYMAFDGDSRAAQDASLPQAAGAPERAVAEQGLADADGVRRGLQQAEAPQGGLLQGVDDNEPGHR